MRGRFITFLFYAHIVLLLFVMPFVFAFGEILTDTVLSIAFVTIYVFNFFFFPVIIKDISRQRDSNKLTHERYEEEKKKNSKTENELKKANELIKRYEKILSDKIKHNTMSGNNFPTLEALDLLSATYDKYAQDDIASFRSQYYEELKKSRQSLEHSNEKLKAQNIELSSQQVECNYYSAVMTLIERHPNSKKKSPKLNEELTYDAYIITATYKKPSDGKKDIYETIKEKRIAYAYFRNNEKPHLISGFLRFLQEDVPEGSPVIVNNIINSNKKTIIISNEGDKYLVKALSEQPCPKCDISKTKLPLVRKQ